MQMFYDMNICGPSAYSGMVDLQNGRSLAHVHVVRSNGRSCKAQVRLCHVDCRNGRTSWRPSMPCADTAGGRLLVAGVMVVVVCGRCSDLRGAQRKSLAADRVPPATRRTSPVGVTHDCRSGGSALVTWSGPNSSPSCPRVWRAVGLPRVTPGLRPSDATVRCRPRWIPLCPWLPRTSPLQEFGPVSSVDVVTRGPSHWDANP